MEHSFDIEMAKKHGIPAAILYRHFQFWIAKNMANGRNSRDGHTWTYNSLRALADQFPYLTFWDVRKGLNTLIKAGIIIKANYNPMGYDRTTWYAFLDEKAALKGLPSHLWNSQMEGVEFANRRCEIRTPIPNPIPNAKQPDKQKGIEISPEKILALDLEIARGKKFFLQQIEEILHPRPREAVTFARITQHLVQQCQQRKLKPSIFKDAIEWARIAKASSAANKKGLFVNKIKKETGFEGQRNLLGMRNKNLKKLASANK